MLVSPKDKCTYIVLVLGIFAQSCCRIITRREIYREQLSPYMGGKVPDSALLRFRLTLNQLNARGLYSSSGITIEHRGNTVHPHQQHASHRTIKVPIPEQVGYVAPEGRYLESEAPTVDTTYVIREPVNVPIRSNALMQPMKPAIPLTSLKLTRYYDERKRLERNRESPWHDLPGDKLDAQVKKEYEPYLKKLHEAD